MRRTSIKADVHQKSKKLLYDTGEKRSSSEKVGGIEGNTRKNWGIDKNCRLYLEVSV